MEVDQRQSRCCKRSHDVQQPQHNLASSSSARVTAHRILDRSTLSIGLHLSSADLLQSRCHRALRLRHRRSDRIIDLGPVLLDFVL
jgi:hypothetical protein